MFQPPPCWQSPNRRSCAARARARFGVPATMPSTSIPSPAVPPCSSASSVVKKLRRLHVDLRALQFARVIHVDALPFRIEIQHRRAGLAVPVAGLLDAPEGQMDFGANGWAIAIRDPA